MSINNDIITALSELDVPVFPDFYDLKIDRYDENGNKLQRLNEWMTFNNVSDTPSMFADDEDIFSESLFDIHFYSPNGKTAVEMKKKIKKCMRKGGFSIESAKTEFENNTRLYHTRVSVSRIETEV